MGTTGLDEEQGAASNDSPPGRQEQASTLACDICPKHFTRRSNLRAHMRNHTGERPFTCSVCQRSFTRQSDMKRHERLHYGIATFVCHGDPTESGQAGCGRTFARRDALRRHLLSEGGCSKLLPNTEQTQTQDKAGEQDQIHVAATPATTSEATPAWNVADITPAAITTTGYSDPRLSQLIRSRTFLSENMGENNPITDSQSSASDEALSCQSVIGPTSPYSTWWEVYSQAMITDGAATAGGTVSCDGFLYTNL